MRTSIAICLGVILASTALAQEHQAAKLAVHDPIVEEAAPTTAIRYHVGVAPDLRSATVTVCAEGAWPERLVPSHPGAAAVAGEPKRLTALYPLALPVAGGAIDTSSVELDQCVRLPVAHEGGAARLVGDDLLLDPRVWLWRPEALPPDVTLTLHLDAPIAAAVPWAHVRGAAGPYRLDPTAFALPGVIALGELERIAVPVGGGLLSVTVLDGRRKATIDGLRRWLGGAGRALSLVYGTLPRSHIEVLVEPVPAEGPYMVPSADVWHGGGATLQLRLSRDATDAKLAEEDFMAVHMLAHLLLPPVAEDARWLEEGIATYYQEVLRARTGGMPPEHAIARLRAGLARALAAQGTGSVVSAEAPPRDPDDQAWQRWAGVAFALAADVRLRAMQTGDSLDGALAALHTCCAEDGRILTARELVGLLDAETYTTIFTTLLDEASRTDGVPVMDRTWQILGVSQRGDGVGTSNDAPFAYVRISIFSAR